MDLLFLTIRETIQTQRTIKYCLFSHKWKKQETEQRKEEGEERRWRRMEEDKEVFSTVR